MNRLITKITQYILPYHCSICEEITDNTRELCDTCFRILPWVEDRCYQCGLRLEGNYSVICEKCQEMPPHYDRLRALFSYDFPIVKLIMGLKFGQQLSYGRVLGELLAEKILKDWYKDEDLPQAIVPIPLHKKRIQQRGFNQSIELIRPFLKQFNVPMLLNSCIRSQNTKAQSSLNANQRKRNLMNAFEITKPINFEHIAIIDDVVTTGSTVNALACQLKKIGVKHVDIWCICRA